MLKKFNFVFILLFLTFLSVSCVFAADNNQTNINNDNSISVDDVSLAPTDNIDVNIDESSRQTDEAILPTPDNMWYVDSNVNISGNGQSTSTAFKTLSEAITKSNNGDTIFIASGTYTGKENLGIFINKSLNLIGYGPEKPIFDAEETSNIFIISADYFNMCGLTFTNSLSAHDSAIVLHVKICNLIDCDFYNNVKKTLMDIGYKSCGGALYTSSDEINLIRCNFIGNSADIGGATFITGSTKIISCNFNNNTAHANGGAIVIHGKGLTNVTKTTFTNNHASENAGAAYFYGDAYMRESIFKGNTARNYENYYIDSS